MNSVAQLGVDDFHSPNRESLRGSHLHDEVEAVQKHLQPLKDSWRKYGCSIIMDGWSDLKKKSIINIFVSSCKGSMFLEAIDTSELLGELITAAYIFQHVKDAIETVGANYVVQVITDNAANCRRMGQLIKSQFP